jgi:FlaA1/EpsC-like NDP-sugar epimerase
MKKLIFMATDTFIVVMSLYLAVALRYGDSLPFEMLNKSWELLLVMVVVGPPIIAFCGLHRIKLHAIESDATMRIAITAAALSLAAIVASYLLKLSGPRSVPIIFGTVFFLLAVSMRVFGLYALRYMAERGTTRLPVIVYGAGAAGIQLAAALRQSVETRPVLFVDDNPNLENIMIAGLPVRSSKELPQLIKKYAAARVLLAIPSLPEQRRDALIADLTALPVEVQVLPSFIDLMSGRSLETSLRSVSPDELLGRDKVDLDIPEIARAYAGRVVMVTGAGGSIGAELCRQLMNCKPAAIVLFEQSEYALYSINSELSGITTPADIPIIARLGSVTNQARVARVVVDDSVDIILHAAAYKHVPMVEENEIEGAANNVMGTKIVADVANEARIERFILVSTDKAVRPTNIMGATKRMAELVIQDIQTRASGTKFAMVRFGNVLGSSGSVLPLFQKQIAQGGPVTVTHANVTRFFMTIPEAARLVLLAGAYAKGGDVFVLDMGAPQKIIDIAKRMIHLSGRKLKDPETGEGDIAIEITGLRPGEKLYEELLITDALSATPHAKILRAEETPLSEMEIALLLRDTQVAIAQGDAAALRRIIEARVDGYHLQGKKTITA